MIALATYVPGHSPVHRLGPGVKLLLLTGFAVVSVFLTRWEHVVALFVLVALAYLVAGLSLRICLAQVRPLAPILLAIGLFQLVFAGTAATIS